MSGTHAVTVPLAWEKAVQRTREALAEQGFGILSEIDVRATFAAKLGAEAADALGDYVIPGACNPALARRALSAEPALGPCCPATWSSDAATTPPKPPSRPSTRRPWSSSALTRQFVRSPTTPAHGATPPWPPSPPPDTDAQHPSPSEQGAVT